MFEKLFSESGYASNAHKTIFASRHFEQYFIFAHNLQHIYFDEEHAVNIFLEQEDKKYWDEAELWDALFYVEEQIGLQVVNENN